MRWLGIACAISALLGCDVRTLPEITPTFADPVGELLSERCGDCHDGAEAEAGYRVGTYVGSIGCLPDGRSAVEPASAAAPVVATLADEVHAGLVPDDEAALLEAWVTAGAPSSAGAQHAVGFADPRSDAFHGRVLRQERWLRARDATVEGACGRCHRGAPARPEGAGSTPRAPDCTSCHDEPGGAFACSTCHGDRGRAAPPRDPCFFPESAGAAGAHAGHATFECAVCHGERDVESLSSGAHGDGVVDLSFDPEVAGEAAAFDAATRSCTNACHSRGGERSNPTWSPDEPSYDCNGCHSSPPAAHYAGPCSDCHLLANEDGTALAPGDLHRNGVVDLGDGSGTCSACHGADGDPNPGTGSHDAHVSPSLTTPIDCAQCHVVPEDPLDPGHLDGDVGAEVVFGDRASARGATPSRDEDGSCRQVACHGDGLDGGFHTTPRWGATDGLAAACGACHGVPPALPHVQSDGCASLLCHGGEVSYSPSGPRISEAGRDTHIDGRVR